MSTTNAWIDQQRALAEQLRASGSIQTTAVFEAFCTIPRHHFLPNTPLDLVYSDRVIATKFEGEESISSSSQPAMMAIMLEQLDLQPGHKVLEIGAGTGFNAALMAHIVGSGGHVTTVDIDDDIVAAAQTHLATAGVGNVAVLCHDGSAGYAANAPYDRIILTVGSWDIFPAWWGQLRENGRLLLPLSLNGPQVSVAFDKRGQQLHSVSMAACGFMRQRGPHAEPLQQLALGEQSGVSLHCLTHPNLPDPATIWPWLLQIPLRLPLPITTTASALWRSFRLWLALAAAQSCLLETHNRPDLGLPALLQSDSGQTWQLTVGLLAADGLAVVGRAAGSPDELVILGFGPGQTAVSHQLYTELIRWHAAGMPDYSQLRLTALPADAPVPDGEFVVLKRPFSTFLCHWDSVISHQ